MIFAVQGALMLTAMVLVCAMAGLPDLAPCDRESALDVILVPEQFSNPVTCFFHGQAYAAQALAGRKLDPDQRMKIVCVPADLARARRTHPVF
jgi:hypothetical protein